jgi:hypothetical protein
MRRVYIFIAFAIVYFITVHLLSEYTDWYKSTYVWVGALFGFGWSTYVDFIFINRYENEIASLKGYVEDLLDEDCPKEYKGVVKEVVFGSKG